ncbi:PIN domain nuclease (plasmid) [Brucella pseudogrignonensis]|nr:PIN domain nuclease [Brucella pseudogrignonensis]
MSWRIGRAASEAYPARHPCMDVVNDGGRSPVSRCYGSHWEAETVSISAISLFEIGQRSGWANGRKWSRFSPVGRACRRTGRTTVEVSAEASLLAATLEWAHRDPFDRFIAATAITRGLTFVSADTAFDALVSELSWPGRVW